MKRSLVVTLLLVAGVSMPTSAQTIRGVVSERAAYGPVELAAIIAIAESGDSIGATLTDEDGYFTITVGVDGQFVLHVSALGYWRQRLGPYQLEDEEVRVVEVSLDARPIVIEGFDVTAARLPALVPTGFYDRMAEGRGQFLTPDDIADSPARFTFELFHGLDHVRPQYAVPAWARTIRFMSAASPGTCQPRIWIDGLEWNEDNRLPGEGLEDRVPLFDVIAAEVYWGFTQAPMRYQGTTVDNSCGVVLLWTRYGSR